MNPRSKKNAMGDVKKEKHVKKVSSRDPFDIIWDWLCSMKVNVIVLILLALTSIFGTVIPQGKPATEWLTNIKINEPALFEWYDFIKFTQLDNMYHSWWYIGLLGLLCITITCCSIDKFPVVWRFFTAPKRDLDNNQIKWMPLIETVTIKADMTETIEKYRGFLSKNVSGTVLQTQVDEEQHLFAEKGVYSRLGVYVTHLSLLVIITGALIGVFFGYKGSIDLYEFDPPKSWMWLRDGNTDKMDMGFMLQCNGYETTYYAPGNIPKNRNVNFITNGRETRGRQPNEYVSNITVTDNGKVVDTVYVKVNHPLKYNGFTFYQSSYGPAMTRDQQTGEPRPVFYAIVDAYRKSDGVQLMSNYLVDSTRPVNIPGTLDSIILETYSEGSLNGKSAKFNLYKRDGSSNSFWVHKKYPEKEDEREGDYKFLLRQVKPKQYTVFQVAKDPGVWTVYTGCGLMIIGTLMAFFLSHKRFWIRLDDEKNGKIKVTFAAIAHKNKENFEVDFEKMREKFLAVVEKKKKVKEKA